MKLSKVLIFLFYIVLVVVLVGGAVVFVAYLNNGQKSFYLQSGSEKIYNDQETFEFSATDYNVFYVKNSLSFTEEQASDIDYSVKVFLNPITFSKYGFDKYDISNLSYTLEAIDVTAYFDIKIEEHIFMIRLNQDLSLTKILFDYHKCFPWEAPSISFDLYSDNFMTLQVTNNSDGTSVSLGIIKEILV